MRITLSKAVTFSFANSRRSLSRSSISPVSIRIVCSAVLISMASPCPTSSIFIVTGGRAFAEGAAFTASVGTFSIFCAAPPQPVKRNIHAVKTKNNFFIMSSIFIVASLFVVFFQDNHNPQYKEYQPNNESHQVNDVNGRKVGKIHLRQNYDRRHSNKPIKGVYRLKDFLGQSLSPRSAPLVPAVRLRL